LISLVFLGVSIYALHRKSTGTLNGGQGHYAGRSLLFFATCVLAVLSNHLLMMWIFLELGTLAIAPLVFYNRGPEAKRASWKYLMFSVVGLGFNFLGLMFIARALAGSGGAHSAEHLTFFIDELWNVHELGDSHWWRLGLALMVFGLGTKLGLAPMYAWLPDAYDKAPPSITAMLAAVQFNCVIVMLFREVGLLRSFDNLLVSEELIVMGVLSLGVSALHIVKVDNFKRLIAYASINHAGTIALGLAVAVNVNAAYGVVLYVVSNAFVKAILFLTCGNIKAQFGTKQVSALRGIIRVMPFSGWAFMLGVFALLGFAPFGGFIAEVTMLSNMTSGVYLVVFFYVCVVLTIVLVVVGRLLFPMIWGDAPDEGVRHHDPLTSNLASLFFVAILVSLGIYTPEPVTNLLQEVAKTLVGH
jgi:hydrogenase-4 component F